jgi:hypothetical protein
MHTTYTGQPLVREYGCVRCQKWHRRGIDPEYEPHLYYQSKHGWHERVATPNEVLAMMRATPKGGAP